MRQYPYFTHPFRREESDYSRQITHSRALSCKIAVSTPTRDEVYQQPDGQPLT